MSTKTLLTVEEYTQLAFPDAGDFELVEGELFPLPSATPLHAEVRYRVERRVRDYFDSRPGGRAFSEVDCALSSDALRRPDLAIFLEPRAQQVDLNKVPIPFPPDIAVEVISPSELAVNVNRKALDYLRAGSQEVWLLDPENGELFVQQDSAMRLLRGANVLESALLPGFPVTVDELLA